MKRLKESATHSHWISLPGAALLLALLSAALLAAAGCRQSSAPSVAPVTGPPPLASVAATAPSDYVGNAVCAECHRAECDVFATGHHVHTLHILDPNRPTEVDPPRGPISLTKFSIDTFGGNYVIAPANDMSRMQPLVFAFGSGKIGVTYASPNGPASLLEMHKTWFPHARRWETTLGQEPLNAEVPGRNRSDGRQCVLCHAVTLPAGTVAPEPKFLGVGCESCHGPAGAHVNAIRSGAKEIAMERLSTWDATRLNTLCGKCHGTAETIPSKRDQQLTERFQPIGLMRSRCFLEGGRSLSCIACHAPHADAEHAALHYEAVCLRCHATNATLRPAPAKANAVCPVNPRSGCIPCHMPGRKAVPNSGIAYLMADHRIAIYPADTKTALRRN